MEPIQVYIEIEKHSNIKNEWNPVSKKLEVDRILPYPYFYPFAYGFIPNTKAGDGDELDILLITNQPILKDTYIRANIVGALIMEDEKGQDEKILMTLPGEKFCLDEETLEDIKWFFSNYKKKNNPEKWSRVQGFVGLEEALQIFKQSNRS